MNSQPMGNSTKIRSTIKDRETKCMKSEYRWIAHTPASRLDLDVFSERSFDLLSVLFLCLFEHGKNEGGEKVYLTSCNASSLRVSVCVG